MCLLGADRRVQVLWAGECRWSHVRTCAIAHTLRADAPMKYRMGKYVCIYINHTQHLRKNRTEAHSPNTPVHALSDRDEEDDTDERDERGDEAEGEKSQWAESRAVKRDVGRILPSDHTLRD